MSNPVRTKKELTRFLCSVGYHQAGGAKHERWYNPNTNHAVFLPRSKHFDCRPMIQRILKEVNNKTN